MSTQREVKAIGSVPESAITQCPAVGFEWRRVKSCETCQHCLGLMVVNEALPMFEQQYRVACVHPISRTIANLSE